MGSFINRLNNKGQIDMKLKTAFLEKHFVVVWQSWTTLTNIFLQLDDFVFHEDDRDVSFDKLRDKIPQVRAMLIIYHFQCLLSSRNKIKFVIVLGKNHQKFKLDDISSRGNRHKCVKH